MASAIDLLLTRTWWSYDPAAEGYSSTYHWLNLVEGAFWLAFAALVAYRYYRFRNSWLELLYALAFVTFALSDFREAFALQSWLIVSKGVNLFAILYLRRLVLRRYYPASRTF